MSTTTSYGTWLNATGDSLGVKSSIDSALGDFVGDFDLDGIETEYRQLIGSLLPESVSLVGDEFIGPAYPARGEFEGFPTKEDGSLDLAAIVESVDPETFWLIAADYDLRERELS